MTGPLLSVEAVARSFGRRRILGTAGMWATPGKITALLGRNGIGKSTLLKITIGQLRAERGIVIYKDIRTARPRHHLLARRGLYYLPQEGALSRWFSVRTHIEAVGRLAPEGAVNHAVKACRLGELLDRRASNMSGGERRRAELGLVVARQPDCLLADEPFIDLAPTDCTLISEILRELAQGGCAIVVTGHEVDVLLEVADDVIWMTAGTTHALGAPEEARSHDQFRREYLGGRMLGRRRVGQKDEKH